MRWGIPDWRNAQGYAGLLDVERSGFAWEWLRRRDDYRRFALQGPGFRSSGERESCAALHFGLHSFEDPALPAPLARPFWRAKCHALVLEAAAEAAADNADAFLLERFGELAKLVRGEGGQHLLLSDGSRSIRLDVRGVPLESGPVRLVYEIAGFACAAPAVLALRRLIHLASTGRFSRVLHPPEPRARRFILMLRAFDALQAGAGQREIAAQLLGTAARQARWRTEASSIRSQAQRLVHAARRMSSESYLKLLR
jgi:hypothetical protein